MSPVQPTSVVSKEGLMVDKDAVKIDEEGGSPSVNARVSSKESAKKAATKKSTTMSINGDHHW